MRLLAKVNMETQKIIFHPDQNQQKSLYLAQDKILQAFLRLLMILGAEYIDQEVVRNEEATFYARVSGEFQGAGLDDGDLSY